MVILSPRERAAIQEAIASWERKTTGEIFCVIAPQASDYREGPVILAAMASFVVPLLALIILSAQQGWTVAHIGAGQDGMSLSLLVALQALVFAAVWFAASMRSLKFRLLPAALKRDRVRQRALEQFHAHGLHQTEARTGVLIFVSLAEHMVELLADEGISELVAPDVWAKPTEQFTSAMRRGELAAGLLAAVEETGRILAAQLPGRAGDINELPDAVVELPPH